MDKTLYTKINDELWIYNHKNESIFMLMRKKSIASDDYYYIYGELVLNAPMLPEYRYWRIASTKELHPEDYDWLCKYATNALTLFSILSDENAILAEFDKDIRLLGNISDEKDLAESYKYNMIVSNDKYYHSRLGDRIHFYNYENDSVAMLMILIRGCLPTDECYYELGQFYYGSSAPYPYFMHSRITSCPELSESSRSLLTRFHDIKNLSATPYHHKFFDELMLRDFNDDIKMTANILCDVLPQTKGRTAKYEKRTN